MDKELLKGLLILLGIVLALVSLFFIVSDSASDKAACIAGALRDHVPVANIDKMCSLTAKKY